LVYFGLAAIGTFGSCHDDMEIQCSSLVGRLGRDGSTMRTNADRALLVTLSITSLLIVVSQLDAATSRGSWVARLLIVASLTALVVVFVQMKRRSGRR
jgi:hypothetical protein